MVSEIVGVINESTTEDKIEASAVMVGKQGRIRKVFQVDPDNRPLVQFEEWFRAEYPGKRFHKFKYEQLQ